MRSHIITEDPNKLYDEIFKEIKAGTLETWVKKTSIDKQKVFISPVGNQYDHILVDFTVREGFLSATIMHETGSEKPTDAVKAIVLGMLSAALLTHLKDHFKKIEMYHKRILNIKRVEK